MGAIVLDESLVRAQRDRDFERTSARTGVASVGRGAIRQTMKAQAQAELAEARATEAAELYRRGAGAMTHSRVAAPQVRRPARSSRMGQSGRSFPWQQ